MSPTRIPEANEAAEYYLTYIKQVPAGDVRVTLESQAGTLLAVFRGISEEQSRHRYAPDKWTIRQLLSHINDTERLFVFRALWFARGFDTPLPSFDQNVAIAAAGADARSWASHVDEFEALRRASVAFFEGLPAEAWDRRGVASGFMFSVRALAYMTAGHAEHHARILRERYL
jgi:DinB superfamily